MEEKKTTQTEVEENTTSKAEEKVQQTEVETTSETVVEAPEKPKKKKKKIIIIVAVILIFVFLFKGCGGSNVIVESETSPYGAEFNITLDELLEKYNENVKNNDLCLDTLKYYTLNVSKDSLMDTKTELDENTIGYQVKYNSSIMWVSTVNIYVNPATNNVTNIVIESNIQNDEIDMAFNYVVPALWMAPVYSESVEDVIDNRLYLDYDEYLYEDGVYIVKNLSDNINTMLSFWAMTDDYYNENFGD